MLFKLCSCFHFSYWKCAHYKYWQDLHIYAVVSGSNSHVLNSCNIADMIYVCWNKIRLYKFHIFSFSWTLAPWMKYRIQERTKCIHSKYCNFVFWTTVQERNESVKTSLHNAVYTRASPPGNRQRDEME